LSHSAADSGTRTKQTHRLPLIVQTIYPGRRMLTKPNTSAFHLLPSKAGAIDKEILIETVTHSSSDCPTTSQYSIVHHHVHQIRIKPPCNHAMLLGRGDGMNDLLPGVTTPGIMKARDGGSSFRSLRTFLRPLSTSDGTRRKVNLRKGQSSTDGSTNCPPPPPRPPSTIPRSPHA
jgi:hypothetical protein